MNDYHTMVTVAAIVLVTAMLRFLPFIIFNGNKKTPRIIEKLGKMLPYAIMGMLVVYCLKEVSFKTVSGFAPELLSCLIVAVIYILKRNTLISILCGTVCYMLLVQNIF